MRDVYSSSSPRLLGTRTAVWLCLGLALSAIPILWIGRRTNIDLTLADAMYDASRHIFPWRHAWLTETFSHGILKTLLTLAGVSFVLIAAYDLWRPSATRTAIDRLRLRAVALSAMLVPGVIALLKRNSDAYCPWDLARYGGDAPYIRLFDLLPAGVGPGHCLPGGHASSALWLLALCVYWLPVRPHAARGVALLAIACGGALGWMQQLRGAHFLTHTLWSIWLACAVVLAVIVCLQAWPLRQRKAALAHPVDDGAEDAAMLR